MICLSLLSAIEILKYIWARCEQRYIVLPASRAVVEDVVKYWKPPYRVIGWDKDDTQVLVERTMDRQKLEEFYCDSLQRLVQENR